MCSKIDVKKLMCGCDTSMGYYSQCGFGNVGNGPLFLTVLEVGKSKGKVQADWVHG